MTVKHKTGEAWITRYWRPIAAMTYIFICIFDFVLAPVLMGFLSLYTGHALIAWVPLTIQGGSIFHISFGSFIGSYGYSHGKENMQRNDIEANAKKPQPDQVTNG